MSKFNKKVTPRKISKPVVNLAGGAAYTVNDEYELVSLLLTSMVEDKYYETAGEQVNRLNVVADRLIAAGKAEFVAQAALYARREFGMRSITHVLAAKIGSAVHADWKRTFFTHFPYRVDDITETIAVYNNFYASEKNGKYRALPNAMKSGFGEALGNFDAYQLAKYRGEDKTVSLVDVVNLLHPKPTEKNGMVTVKWEEYKKVASPKKLKAALKLRRLDGRGYNKFELDIPTYEALTLGLLKNTDTWESQLSKVGQEVPSEDFSDAKGDVYAKLLKENRLGYLALIRNLRNILETAPEIVPDVAKAIVNRKEIAKSKVFPFVYLQAFVALNEVDKNILTNDARKLITDALSDALEISSENVPSYYGTTLIVLDVSGSMTGILSNSKSKIVPAQIGSVFLAMIGKRNPNADLMVFDGRARYIKVNLDKKILDIAANIEFPGGSTNLPSVFQTANKAYDRIIILSDMQTWVSGYIPADTHLKEYKQRTGANPRIYSFDLSGYGNLAFPQENVFLVAGYSDKALKFINASETKDKNSLLKEISAYKI